MTAATSTGPVHMATATSAGPGHVASATSAGCGHKADADSQTVLCIEDPVWMNKPAPPY